MKKIITFSAIGLLSLLAVLSVNAEEKPAVATMPNINYEEKVKVIDEMVKNNELTNEQAEEIKEKLSNCTGEKRNIGKEYNLQFGKKLGKGQGKRNGNGNCDGSCQKNN